MKYSIKTQLLLSFLIMTGLMLGVSIFANNVFLEKYYVYQKQQDLINIYQNLNRVSDSDIYKTEEFDEFFQKISGQNNVQITILKPNINGVFTAIYESQDNMIMRGRVEGYLFGFVAEDDLQNVLVQTDAYRIQKCRDSFAETEFLESWGMFDTGCYYLMRIPLQSIHMNVLISNRFMIYTFLAGVAVALIFSLWISRRITAPISELTGLSKRMANLDFDVRYSGKGKSEIDQLGENFNSMSETLEHTISELKTANNELQLDLENKIRVDEMRREFLSNVSHELKTPISLVQGYAEGLKECVFDDEESREYYCDVIIDEAVKMNSMVKQLLSLNQIESGNEAVTFERFDLTELVRGVIQSAKILADQKSAQITCDLNGPLYVWGDEFRIEEVVTNYISNAINHVDGDKLIDVSAAKIDGRMRIFVYNTGEAIPDESLDKVWEKFYKVDKARTRAYGGTGIGLSIVKAIMESHHQRYGCYNKNGGVVFWFELDCA